MSAPAASAVIACASERRWEPLLRAIASARAQVPPPREIVVAVDHNAALSARLRAEVPNIEIVDNAGVAGASGTRNAGAALAHAPVLVFLDDDVQAQPGWLGELLAPFADPQVVGSGGRVTPAWQCPRPRWFPDEFAWVVGASHAGLPIAAAAVRNVWSENMAVRRDAFEAVGGFRGGFGKVGHTSRPEDTDLCIRVSADAAGMRWIYVPTAVVDHEVPPERCSFAFYLRRCFAEGAGKIELSDYLGAERALSDERLYVLRTLPLAVVRDLRRGEVTRALAILAGAAAAGAGAALSLARAVGSRFTR